MRKTLYRNLVNESLNVEMFTEDEDVKSSGGLSELQYGLCVMIGACASWSTIPGFASYTRNKLKELVKNAKKDLGIKYASDLIEGDFDEEICLRHLRNIINEVRMYVQDGEFMVDDYDGKAAEAVILTNIVAGKSGCGLNADFTGDVEGASNEKLKNWLLGRYEKHNPYVVIESTPKTKQCDDKLPDPPAEIPLTGIQTRPLNEELPRTYDDDLEDREEKSTVERSPEERAAMSLIKSDPYIVMYFLQVVSLYLQDKNLSVRELIKPQIGNEEHQFQKSFGILADLCDHVWKDHDSGQSFSRGGYNTASGHSMKDAEKFHGVDNSEGLEESNPAPVKKTSACCGMKGCKCGEKTKKIPTFKK